MQRVPDNFFENEASPTVDEFRAWAQGDFFWPMEDWDLCICDREDLWPVMIEFVGRPESADSMLSLLYPVAALLSRSFDQEQRRRELEGLLALPGAMTAPAGLLWRERVKSLIADRSLFNDAFWFEGGWRAG